MLVNSRLKVILGMIILTPALAAAQGGHVGGGDHCRNEINKHRQTLLDWIQSGYAEELDLSQSKTSVKTYEDYKTRMLQVLQPNAVNIRCYMDPARKGDLVAQKIAAHQSLTYRAITLFNSKTGQNEPTTCINKTDANGKHSILCDYEKIVNAKDLGNPNYIMTHHEYASIAGVELRKTDSEPDFSISNQLGEFETYITYKALGKKNHITQNHIALIQCNGYLNPDERIVLNLFPTSYLNKDAGVEPKTRDARNGYLFVTTRKELPEGKVSVSIKKSLISHYLPAEYSPSGNVFPVVQFSKDNTANPVGTVDLEAPISLPGSITKGLILEYHYDFRTPPNMTSVHFHNAAIRRKFGAREDRSQVHLVCQVVQQSDINRFADTKNFVEQLRSELLQYEGEEEMGLSKPLPVGVKSELVWRNKNRSDKMFGTFAEE